MVPVPVNVFTSKFKIHFLELCCFFTENLIRLLLSLIVGGILTLEVSREQQENEGSMDRQTEVQHNYVIFWGSASEQSVN